MIPNIFYMPVVRIRVIAFDYFRFNSRLKNTVCILFLFTILRSEHTSSYFLSESSIKSFVSFNSFDRDSISSSWFVDEFSKFLLCLKNDKILTELTVKMYSLCSKIGLILIDDNRFVRSLPQQQWW